MACLLMPARSARTPGRTPSGLGYCSTAICGTRSSSKPAAFNSLMRRRWIACAGTRNNAPMRISLVSTGELVRLDVRSRIVLRPMFVPALAAGGTLTFVNCVCSVNSPRRRRHRDHVEASSKCGLFLFASVPSSQLLHFLEIALEAGGMMHNQEDRAVTARIVKAVDRCTRDKGECACSSRVSLVADAQHHLTFEDVEELVAPAMIMRPGADRPRLDSSFPDGAQAAGLCFRRLDRHARASAPDRNKPSLAGSHHNSLHHVPPHPLHADDSLTGSAIPGLRGSVVNSPSQ